LTIYTTSVTSLDHPKQRENDCRSKAKIELGNITYFCGRRQKKEKSLKPKLDRKIILKWSTEN